MVCVKKESPLSCRILRAWSNEIEKPLMSHLEGLGCVQGGLVDLPQPFDVCGASTSHLPVKIMRPHLTHWHFYFFGIFCCNISHLTNHAPIFYAKRMVARRLRRFFEVNLFYSLSTDERGDSAYLVVEERLRSWEALGSSTHASHCIDEDNMPTRSQPSKKAQ